jgi:predicted Fe-S protein YdhL (DUF1289 family)/uncharacterized protein (DUF433 family)
LIASPCTKVCVMDAEGRYCLGCARTLDEIARWGAMTDDERSRVMADLPSRRSIASTAVEGTDGASSVPGYHGAIAPETTMDVRRIVHSDPEILGGVPVFVGTRVPVKTLYDYLEAGDTLDEFLDDFPAVTREQAIAALELARTMTEAHAAAA